MPSKGTFPGLKRLAKGWCWAASQLDRGINPGFQPRTVPLWRGTGTPTGCELLTIMLRCEQLTAALEGHHSTPPRRAPVDGMVYFLRGGNLIKIGFSANVAARLSDLRTASSSELVLIGTLRGGPAVEHHLHRKFRDLRVRGEWFRPAPRLLRYIERAASTALQQKTGHRALPARVPDGPENFPENIS